jgi:Leucine-rich repeat (LRR) protein
MSSRYSYIHLLLPLLLILSVTQLVNNPLAQAETNSFDCTSVTQIPQSECEALVALYDSTDGDNWLVNSGWLETNTPCSWYRVTCISGYVTEVRLWDNQLSGMIPPELSNLTNLQALHLGGNQLSGAVLPELGNLTNLQFLHLSVNQLSGAIPPELGNLTNLEGLYLSANQLSGAIPPELGNLTNLGGLYLLGNQLTGTVPPELGNLTNLQALHLSSNQLSGAIPPELGNLTNLQWLHLSNNQLSGEVPLELANPANLGVLDLQGNQLSGAVPPELGNLTNLQRLDLSSNQLSGPIPLELTNLTNLQSLRLEGNQLSGAIPSELGSLTNLQRLHLSNNQLNEEIPPELGNLTNLQWLRLEDNQLSGEIPMSFVNLTNLYSFWFAQTNLCEPPDPTFQAWLSSVPDVRSPGVLCDPTIPPECHAANAARQPLLLVTGWSGSKPSASQDDQLKFFFGANGHLAPYGYVEGCNLFYAEATSPYRWLDDNGHVIRDNLCLAYTQVKAFNPGWSGRFEIIAFSYGGLRARAYLENSDLYGEKCPGTQNRVYVDNLFTMGTPHGGEPYPLLRSLLPFAGIIGLCAVANVPLFCEEGGGQWPALAEMHPATRLAQNLSSSQANGVCYRLLSGDARQQSPQFPRRLIALTAPFPSTYLTANDLAVHRNSAYILNKFPYSLLYSRTVPIDTPDLHGHAPEDMIGQHTLRSYVNPNTVSGRAKWRRKAELNCNTTTKKKGCHSSPFSRVRSAINSGPCRR